MGVYVSVRMGVYVSVVIKLFFKESNKYVGWTDNWGNTKGLDDFENVCVVLNPTTLKAFEKKNLSELAPSTANKLYVACTRAKRNLYFVSQKELLKYQITPKCLL
jgi:ATP-dependent exoDNAse (exonuclease V) beta subunit